MDVEHTPKSGRRAWLDRLPYLGPTRKMMNMGARCRPLEDERHGDCSIASIDRRKAHQNAINRHALPPLPWTDNHQLRETHCSPVQSQSKHDCHEAHRLRCADSLQLAMPP